MKQISIKIAPVFMALLLLMSTTSFVVIDHYCGGELVVESLFESEGCCASDESEVPMEKGCCTPGVTDCCDEVIYAIEPCDQPFVKTNTKIETTKKLVVTAIQQGYQYKTLKTPDRHIPIDDYSPPLLTCDTTILHQVFRI